MGSSWPVERPGDFYSVHWCEECCAGCPVIKKGPSGNRDSSTGWKHVSTQGPRFNPCQLKSLWSTAQNTTACANPNPNYIKSCTQRRVPFKFPETQDRTGTGMYVGQTQTGPMFTTTGEQVSIITLVILLNMLITE